jgi:integrase
MPKRARKVDYLFHKNGSPNYYIRFQRGGKDVITSLRTSNRLEAETRAAVKIGEHKAALLAARPRVETTWLPDYPPGLHVIDGQQVFATERELRDLRTGAVIGPNGGLADVLTPAPRGGPSFKAYDEAKRTAPPTKNGDDAILETYLKHANVTGYYEREARAVWALFRSLCDKPLKDTTRDDGRKVVQHFEAQGLKSATIQKKIGWLTSAVNLAIKEGRLKFNPFSSVVPKRDDKQTRLPLNEADMKEAKRSLGELDKSDQVLFRLLATTGMRLSEAFEIDGEATERGVRYVIVGKKTEQSLRRVPLPADVLAHFPKSIKGRLFVGTPAAASKRLNRFLRDVGIADPRKVVHSLRHRAQDRLRAAGCPEDVRWALLGHEERTVAAGYGEGFPVTMLAKWMAKIGF